MTNISLKIASTAKIKEQEIYLIMYLCNPDLFRNFSVLFPLAPPLPPLSWVEGSSAVFLCDPKIDAFLTSCPIRMLQVHLLLTACTI